MRTSRLFVEQDLPLGSDVTLHARAAHYLSQVLRLRSGDAVVLFNGDGNDVAAELLVCSKRECIARLGRVIRSESPPLLRIHLAIGISRGERMDYAIQKSVELGVSSITPLITERSVVQLKGERKDQRLSHWRAVVIGACEQCGRAAPPEVSPPVAITGWLPSSGGGILLYHRSGTRLPSLAPPGAEIRLLVGPEGGLSDGERVLAEDSGFVAVRMGPRVLRTETAPIAALAAIQALWGDFR
ncbi:MAG: 16S rRNA (uracil(1498)-N(3))-methyltransferase [Gammaproteobacteria bacterium]|nr:16S rRNA (uracil(1498)-N(3))-methyltransferase [Gammaproteobacteria bacterium]